LHPLFDSYNDLVRRMNASEEDWARREAELRSEMRNATRTLMQQQLTLLHEQRQAEQREICAQLAHDIRNPLAGILAAVGNLQREAIDDEHHQRLTLIGEEVMRLSRQLDGLVNSSRQPPEVSTPLAVCDVAEAVFALISYQLPPDIEFGCDVDAELTLCLPEDGFRRALRNLIINSAHALGGTPGTIAIASDVNTKHVIISVRDSGPGFSDEELEAGVRGFGSYCTNGAGLWLATVRRFVNDLGGHVEIANNEGAGACVSLEFPKSLSRG
jgi:signal transduction histidine kinase